MRYVIDASVAVKWLLPEDHTEEAESLLADGITLLAPDLIFAEVGNVLWKRVSGKELKQEGGREALSRLLEIDILVTPASLLLDRAFQLACEYRRTVYDSVYVALAMQEDARLVTADKRFYNATLRTPLAENVAWIGSFAAT